MKSHANLKQRKSQRAQWSHDIKWYLKKTKEDETKLLDNPKLWPEQMNVPLVFIQEMSRAMNKERILSPILK